MNSIFNVKVVFGNKVSGFDPDDIGATFEFYKFPMPDRDKKHIFFVFDEDEDFDRAVKTFKVLTLELIKEYDTFGAIDILGKANRVKRKLANGEYVDHSSRCVILQYASEN